MTLAAARHPYIEALLKGYQPPHSPLAWLNARRSAALERANALAVPTTRDEEWRFTDISPLTKLPFQPATGVGVPKLALADLSHFVIGEATARLVFVDGWYAPELSATDALPAGVQVSNFAQALNHHGALIEPHLARHVPFDDNLFAALNTCFLRDGALVRIAKDQAHAAPVHLLFVSTRPEIAAYPRCLVVAEAGSECIVIEDYVGLTDGVYVNNAVTEIAVAAGAHVRHVKLQRESKGSFHIANCGVALGRDAGYASHTVTLGARMSRHNLSVVQQAEGADARIDGLAWISERQLADTHTLLDHAKPHGKSVQIHKCIVDGAAHAVFNGKVLVREGAQLTDSAQESRNLLLSSRAHVDTKPQLEIFADDVKCSHGATVGQLDAEQVFYLKSRGLSEARARSLLTYAFGAEIIDRIPVPSLVARLEQIVLDRTQTASQA